MHDGIGIEDALVVMLMSILTLISPLISMLILMLTAILYFRCSRGAGICVSVLMLILLSMFFKF